MSILPPESETLRALMAAYQQGDVQSFDLLYAVLAPPLRRYLHGQARDAGCADDLVQEVFLRIHRARHTYDPRLPVEPWAYAIARHVFLMDRRKKARSREVGLFDAAGAPAAEASPAEARVAPHELARALSDLGPERRDPVLLHHVWGFSFAEIGARLGIRGGAARVRASRGLRALRELLRRRR